jgi:DNA primase
MNDIVDTIGKRVKLTPRGSNYVGNCPFCADKKGHFTVSRKKGFFHCFQCKSSGDVITYLMKTEGKTFKQVVGEGE